MNYIDMITTLRLGDCSKALDVDWKLSDAAYPGDNEIPFLKDDFIKKFASVGGLDDSVATHLIKRVVPEIRKNQALLHLLWHQYYLLYISNNPARALWGILPHINWIVSDDTAYSYNLLLAMAGYPRAIEIHKKLGIPEDICKDTYTDLEVWCDFYKQSKNVIGFTPRILSWMQGHLNGELYRIGRFQYKHVKFHYKFSVFRNVETSDVIALADDGIKVNRAGLRDGVEDDCDEKAWTTEYVETEDFAEGNVIVPSGYISRDRRKLGFDEWKKELSHGDSVLEIHIPAIGPMSIDLCASSMSAAAEFFGKYFPAKPFSAFVCGSWFLDNQFEKLLDEKSNIIRLQREFYLFPIMEGGHKETLWRVFGETALSGDVKDYPCNTSMQKSFAKFVRDGGKFRAGGAFYLKDDLPFGRHVYKRLTDC